MTQGTDPHPALSYVCPFCGADRGQPCRARRSHGRETRLHSRRVALTREPFEAPRHQALCCECGNLRTYKQASIRGWWAANADWKRQLCDLKCSVCGRITTHASVGGTDVDEMMQSVALGGEVPERWHWDAARLRLQYRQGNLPRNPYLRHWRYNDAAQRAWDSGNRTVTALCGAPITLHRNPSEAGYRSVPMSEFVEPEEVHDVEYEDPDTGLWWVDMDCVDCLRVTNANRLKHQRRELLSLLLEVSVMVKDMDAVQVAELREHVERLMSDVGGTDSG